MWRSRSLPAAPLLPSPRRSARKERARRLARAAVETSVVALIGGLLLILARHLATTGSVVMGDDMAHYLDVARRLAAGEVPYRDFPFEYPPLALVPIVAPLLAWIPGGLDIEGYSALLVLENALLVCATAICVGWLARRGWSARGSAATMVLFIGLATSTPIIFWRYDAFAALLTALAVCAIALGRSGSAGLILGLGAAAKLYPLALFPMLALGQWATGGNRSLIRLSAALATSVLAFVGGLLVIGAHGFDFLAYQTGRGVQLESALSSVVLLGHLLGGPAARTYQGFSSWQVDSPMIATLEGPVTAVTVIVVLALMTSAIACYVSDRRSFGEVRPQTQVVHLTAVVLAAILAFRAISPQYLVWLLPLAALLPRPKVIAVLIICAVSLYVFPLAYRSLIELEPQPIVALAFRNFGLLVLLAWLSGPGVIQAARMLARSRPRRRLGTAREL